MESELKKIQDIAIKAYNGVMEDREADEAIREILAKYGIPKEKSKNVTAEQLYSTRLVHAERDTKDGKTQKNVKTSAERNGARPIFVLRRMNRSADLRKNSE